MVPFGYTFFLEIIVSGGFPSMLGGNFADSYYDEEEEEGGVREEEDEEEPNEEEVENEEEDDDDRDKFLVHFHEPNYYDSSRFVCS